MSRRDTLAESALFGELRSDALDELCPLMSPVAFEARDVVFRQGEPGDHLIVVGTGQLQAYHELPGGDQLRLGTMWPGHVVGELSLLGAGVRTATVRAVTPTTGWMISRSAFEILRQGVRPAALEVLRAIGLQAVARLDRLYRRCAHELCGDPPTPGPTGGAIGVVGSEPMELDYLGGLLFFADFSRAGMAEVTAGLPRLAAGRGALLCPPGEQPAALWVVLRGAVETSMRSRTARRSLRLAGPGRAVGHLGLFGDGAFVDGVEIRARERSVLLEVPWERVHELVGDELPSSRRFAAALWTDVVRALQHGERPLASTGMLASGGVTRRAAGQPVIA